VTADKRHHTITRKGDSLWDETAWAAWMAARDRRLTPPKRERFVRAADRERTT
jgi:hypothetical protein